MIWFAVLVLTSYIPFISVQVLVVTHLLVVHASSFYVHHLSMDSVMDASTFGSLKAWTEHCLHFAQTKALGCWRPGRCSGSPSARRRLCPWTTFAAPRWLPRDRDTCGSQQPRESDVPGLMFGECHFKRWFVRGSWWKPIEVGLVWIG